MSWRCLPSPCAALAPDPEALGALVVELGAEPEETRDAAPGGVVVPAGVLEEVDLSSEVLGVEAGTAA